MQQNPYQSPETSLRPRGWRRFWKFTCLGCLVSFAVFLLTIHLLTLLYPESTEARWFVIVVGLLALGELGSLVIACCAGIGWVLTGNKDTSDAAQ